MINAQGHSIFKVETNKTKIQAYLMETFNNLYDKVKEIGFLGYDQNFIDENLKKDSSQVQSFSSNAQKLLSAKNVIFRGAPGTGKTYLAKSIASEIVSGGFKSDYDKLSDEEKSRIGFVQFHPSYDYSDFVEGLRPVITENNEMFFEVKDGCFKRFINNAIKHEFVEKAFTDEDVDAIISNFLSNKEYEGVIYKTVQEGTVFSITGANDKYIQTYVPSHTQPKDSGLRLDVLKLLVKSDLDLSTPKELYDYVKEIVSSTYYLGNASYMLPVYNHIRTLTKVIKNYVFIIDEINRGEISKIFGELFFSIDPGYRGTAGAVSTQYSYLHDDPDELLYIPENVYIIGTMNDIDRSVESFDFAMRRRFRFVYIKADDNIKMLDKLYEADSIKARMKKLNEAIATTEGLNENYQIGAAYFKKLENLKKDSGSYDFDALWNDYLEPLLHDYVIGMPNEQELMKKFKDQYDLINDKTDVNDNKGSSEN
ncbi:MAG: McrB family protein [Succinivibrio sp.]